MENTHHQHKLEKIKDLKKITIKKLENYTALLKSNLEQLELKSEITTTILQKCKREREKDSNPMMNSFIKDSKIDELINQKYNYLDDQISIGIK